MRQEFINQFRRSWVAVAVAGVSAGVSIYKGAKQKSDAKKQLAAINGQEVPQALLDNKGIATQLASQGLPSEQYAMAQKNIDRQNTLALSRANSRRGGLGLISTIQQGTDDAYGRLDAQNAQMRVNNEGKLMNVNSQIGGYQNQKYQGDYNYARSEQGAGNQNINSGIDSALAAVGTGATGYMKQRNNQRGLYGGGYGGYGGLAGGSAGAYLGG